MQNYTLSMLYMNPFGIAKTAYADLEGQDFNFQINEPFIPINLYLNNRLQGLNQPSIDQLVLSVINSDIVDVSSYDETLFLHAGSITFHLPCLYDKVFKYHTSPTQIEYQPLSNYTKISFLYIPNSNVVNIVVNETIFNPATLQYDEITIDVGNGFYNDIAFQNFFRYKQFYFRANAVNEIVDLDLYLNSDRNEFYHANKFMFGDKYLWSSTIAISNDPFYDIKNAPF